MNTPFLGQIIVGNAHWILNMEKTVLDLLNAVDPLTIEMFEEIKENAKEYKYPLATKTICEFVINRIRNDQYRKV